MKRLFVIPILLVILCSCINEEYGILKYQDKDFEAEITVNGEYKIKVIKGEEISLEIQEPKNLQGVKFEIEENEILIKNGSVEIPASKENLRGIYAISQIFSLEEKNLTLCENDRFTFEQENVIYILTIDKNNLPKKVEIYSPYFKYEITVDRISEH